MTENSVAVHTLRNNWLGLRLWLWRRSRLCSLYCHCASSSFLKAAQLPRRCPLAGLRTVPCLPISCTCINTTDEVDIWKSSPSPFGNGPVNELL